MRDLLDHAANRSRIRPFNHLVQPGESQPLHNFPVFHRSADHRPHPLQLDLAARRSFRCFGCHFTSLVVSRWSLVVRKRLRTNDKRLACYSASTALPRSSATCSRLLSFFSASNVALITLCGLVVPIDFVSTFCTPTDVITARTAPPAITPVPSGAGFSSTIPEPKRPSTVCGTVVCVRLILIRFFFADSIPLRMACGTSFALPDPKPTTAAEGSPTTTSAANDMFLPPLTTFVTRLIETTWSFNWNEPASSFLVTLGILKSRFLCRRWSMVVSRSRIASD